MERESSISVEQQFTQNSADFGNHFYSAVIKNSNGNVVISPFSVHSCIGLTYMGAGSKTADEIVRGLKLPFKNRWQAAKCFQEVIEKLGTNPSLRIANKIYLANGLEVKSDFHGFSKNNFYAEEENLDFENPRVATLAINNWVEKKTNNKVYNLIREDMLDEDTLLVLVNATYFKGEWKTPFRTEATRQEPFWISEKESKEVDMMYRQGKVKCIRNCAKLDASVVELEYHGPGNLSMMVILPSDRTGLGKFEEQLRKVDFLCLSNSMESREIVLQMPKFVIEFSIDLQLPFKQLGMMSMFKNNADFSNMCISKKGGLKVSKAVHKAVIEVNEEGKEAAAATESLSITKLIDFEFRADHPFFFVIKTKCSILFIGRYLG